MLDEMKYMRACIKESMRLMPVVPANARTTQTEVVLSNYLIPKGVSNKWWRFVKKVFEQNVLLVSPFLVPLISFQLK